MEKASISDSRYRANRTIGALDGMPLAIKDNILLKGMKCTAGSEILREF